MIIWYLIKIEEIFSFMPKHFGHIGKIQMLKKFQAVHEFCMLPDNFGQIIWLEQNISFLPTILGALSHERDYYVEKNKIRNSCEHERKYFNHLK
jgi:hypothetical protein